MSAALVDPRKRLPAGACGIRSFVSSQREARVLANKVKRAGRARAEWRTLLTTCWITRSYCGICISSLSCPGVGGAARNFMLTASAII
jgi:hypothetical protein